jgi:Icc-related predicted phosphoesterase
MRVRVYSDLHFEFHRDKGKSFVALLDPRGVDLLVLAGDITKMKVGFLPTLTLFRQKFQCPIVYVHGNHEFYESSRERVTRSTREAVQRLRGVYWLDNDIVEIEGRRILGTPLWYPKSRPPETMISTQEEWDRGLQRYYHPKAKKVVDEVWPDFCSSEGWEKWIYKENEKATQFLLDNMREGDIVVTHMLPSRQLIAPQWERAPTNAFFVTDLTPIIVERKPALWCFGHTHESIDTALGQTRAVCNPFGYVPKEINPNFDEHKNVDLDPLTIQTVPDTTGA